MVNDSTHNLNIVLLLLLCQGHKIIVMLTLELAPSVIYITSVNACKTLLCLQLNVPLIIHILLVIYAASLPLNSLEIILSILCHFPHCLEKHQYFVMSQRVLFPSPG